MAVSLPAGVDAKPADAVARHLAGDPMAADQLYRSHRRVGIRIATRAGAEDPEGILDQVFVDVLAKVGELHDPTDRAFGAYLYRSITNRVLQEHRRRPVRSVVLDEEAHAADRRDGFDEAVVDREYLGDLLGQLTEPQRAVIVHRFLHDRTAAETAERLERSPAAVRQLQRTALARLRFVVGVASIVLVALMAALVAAGLYPGQPATDPAGEQVPDTEPAPEAENRQPDREPDPLVVRDDEAEAELDGPTPGGQPIEGDAPARLTGESGSESESEESDQPDGPAGADDAGETDTVDGSAGADGSQGTDGVNGADGTDGADGADGADGSQGTDGTGGVDGADGTNGGLDAELAEAAATVDYYLLQLLLLAQLQPGTAFDPTSASESALTAHLIDAGFEPEVAATAAAEYHGGQIPLIGG
ncbi:MAG: sigma-70 family RNA polymerase sigma factor [Actinomycetota bacterium]